MSWHDVTARFAFRTSRLRTGRVGVFVVGIAALLLIYVTSFYHLRSFTSVAFPIEPVRDGYLPIARMHFVSLADDESLHQALTAFYFPLVWWDAAEVGVTFGQPLSQGTIEAYPAGSRFYISGDQLREIGA